jgi:hypothetical protein
MACGDAFVLSLFATLSRVAFIYTRRDAADLCWVCGKVGCPWRPTAESPVVRGRSVTKVLLTIHTPFVIYLLGQRPHNTRSTLHLQLVSGDAVLR